MPCHVLSCLLPYTLPDQNPNQKLEAFQFLSTPYLFIPSVGVSSMSVSSPNFHATSFPYSPEAVSLDSGVKSAARHVTIPFSEEKKERVRELFSKIDLSISSYDTAWIAMVPSPNSVKTPRFPECVNWLLDNQLSDGSWGLPHRHPLLIKDALSSTLACILALKQWGFGEKQVNKGLEFIASNSASINDQNQHTPIGFDIIFSGMIDQAKSMNLNLPLRSIDEEMVRCRRYMELRRAYENISEGKRMYLSYVSEGMGEFCDWEMIMKYQRKNESLFNSPSTTAFAFSKTQNPGCLRYLDSLLEKFRDAVPAVYPLELYPHLCVVDNLDLLGIDCYFKEEIASVLDHTYRHWLQGEQEIFLDVATTAMAFRILRKHGYNVSAERLSAFAEEGDFHYSLEGYVNDTGAVLELYKASQMAIYQDEIVLDRIKSWTSRFLKEGMLNPKMYGNRLDKYIRQEVHDALRYPITANLERLGNRRNMENYNIDNSRILKTVYWSPAIGNVDFLNLAIDDFNTCQLMLQEELKYLGRWNAANRLDKLEFARQKLHYCYFSAAATLSGSELSDARIAWAKNSVLTTVVDDFFDVGGSIEEIENLIQLVKMWDVNISTECCSEKVEIIFSALKSTICEIGETALKWQGRDVTDQVAEIWLDLLESMFLEAKWTNERTVPTMDEYMANAFVSFALGPIVLPALYFVGPKLSESVVRSGEFNNLFKIMSTCGRLLNDIMGFKRESKEGKLNAVALQMIHEGMSEEQSINRMKDMIDSYRRELLRMVLQEEDSVIPRACKNLFWHMSTVLNLFYSENDGFTSQDMINAVKSFLTEPVSHREGCY